MTGSDWNVVKETIIQRRVEFQRVMRIMKKNGLFDIVERDFNLLLESMKEMTVKERNDTIETIVKFGTLKLFMSGFDKDQCNSINNIIKRNISYMITNSVRLSINDVYEYSISNWKNSENNIVKIKRKQICKGNKIKAIYKEALNLTGAAGMVVLDALMLKKEMSYANMLSIISCLAFLVNMIDDDSIN